MRLFFRVVGILLVITLLGSVYAATTSTKTTDKFSFSESSSRVQYSQPSRTSYSYSQASSYWPALSNSDKCEASQDFIMMVQPNGCSPAVVRSDLLEEQNVPVFCKVDIIKLNPLIDISTIKSVKFSGIQTPSSQGGNNATSNNYVAGVSFHPNREAIYSQKGFLDNPLINDVGYVVVVLKRVEAEKNMPESVKLNLTGVLSYNAEGLIGSGNANYILKPVNDADWSRDYKENSFFKGNGYLRLEEINNGIASVSIYRDADEKLASFQLAKGESSRLFYMPGFYCKAGVQIKVEDIGSVGARARLEVDDDIIWVVQGQKFLDNLCVVNSISASSNNAIEVKINKDEITDEGGNKYNFKVVETWVNVDITFSDGIKKLYTVTEDNNIKLFEKGKWSNNLIIEGESHDAVFNRGLIEKVKKIRTITSKTTGTNSITLSCKGQRATLTIDPNKDAKAKEDEIIDEISKEIFDKAKREAENIKAYYGDAGEGGEIYAAKALFKLGVLADSLKMRKTANDIFIQITQDYPDTPYSRSAELKIGGLGSPDTSYGTHTIKLRDIETPTKEEFSADFTVTDDKGTRIDKTTYIQEGERFSSFRLVKLSSDKADLVYIDSGNRDRETRFSLDYNDTTEILSDGKFKITLGTIRTPNVVRVSVITSVPNAYSQASFPIEIGIEKRAIQLSPEKIEGKIKQLNESIAKWESIVNRLGKAVSTMKGVCLATSGVLTIKNFISNLGGGATARQAVMPAYYEKCSKQSSGDKNAFNDCLRNENNNIESDIANYKNIIAERNKQMLEIEKNSLYKGTETVDRSKAVPALISQNPELSGGITHSLSKIDDNGNLINSGETITINREELEKYGSLTELNNYLTYKKISEGSGSQIAKDDAKEKLDSIVYNINQRAKTASGSAAENGETPQTDLEKLYSGNDNWLNSVKVVYYSGKNSGLASVVPIPETYQGKTGFYVYVPENPTGKAGGWTDSGDLKMFWIKNIGKEGVYDINGDDGVLLNTNVNYPKSILGLDDKSSQKIITDTLAALQSANQQYGKSRVNILGRDLIVDRATVINEKRCTDFMSAQDCHILFNVCDPVVCPPSRCDLGGSYRVDNVIQSGIAGSIFLCLPNIKEGIAVPVCLSGIHAGLDSFVSIMKSYRDCLQEQYDSGKVVGICDEIQSVYLCEFFWRQVGPFVDMFIYKMIESGYGQGYRGGGEYMTVQDAFTNLQGTISYMKEDYAANSYKAFQMRSIGDVGTSFCKNFVSTSVPEIKTLLEPDSPVQFYSWFDEIPFTEATSPSTSQYKVYYHIYAGKDAGVNYQIYLKNPPTATFSYRPEMVVVDTGFIAKGGYASQTRDLTAPSGYKELCVRINGKDECGFKKVSTDFAVNYVADAYYKEQAQKTDIKTEKECVSGSAVASGLLQGGNTGELIGGQATSAVGLSSEELDKKGIVRICSSTNPGQTTNPGRWVSVGICDQDNIVCWLDQESVKDVIKNKNIEEDVLDNAIKNSKVSEKIEETTYDYSAIQKIFTDSEKWIENFGSQSNSASNKKDFAISVWNNKQVFNGKDKDAVILDLDNAENNGGNDVTKAKAVFYKFLIYHDILKIIVNAEKQASKSSDVKFECKLKLNNWDLVCLDHIVDSVSMIDSTCIVKEGNGACNLMSGECLGNDGSVWYRDKCCIKEAKDVAYSTTLNGKEISSDEGYVCNYCEKWDYTCGGKIGSSSKIELSEGDELEIDCGRKVNYIYKFENNQWYYKIGERFATINNPTGNSENPCLYVLNGVIYEKGLNNILEHYSTKKVMRFGNQQINVGNFVISKEIDEDAPD